jgi:hypothetical protein
LLDRRISIQDRGANTNAIPASKQRSSAAINGMLALHASSRLFAFLRGSIRARSNAFRIERGTHRSLSFLALGIISTPCLRYNCNVGYRARLCTSLVPIHVARGLRKAAAARDVPVARLISDIVAVVSADGLADANFR